MPRLRPRGHRASRASPMSERAACRTRGPTARGLLWLVQGRHERWNCENAVESWHSIRGFCGGTVWDHRHRCGRSAGQHNSTGCATVVSRVVSDAMNVGRAHPAATRLLVRRSAIAGGASHVMEEIGIVDRLQGPPPGADYRSGNVRLSHRAKRTPHRHRLHLLGNYAAQWRLALTGRRRDRRPTDTSVGSETRSLLRGRGRFARILPLPRVTSCRSRTPDRPAGSG